MKRSLLILLAFYFNIILFQNIYSQNPCTPVPGGAGEGCANPCWVCLNPYIGNTFNFQGSGIQPSSGFCGGNTFLHNDQFLLFKPTCFGVGAVTFTITSNNGCSIQAAIYKVTGNCTGQTQLECDPGFSGTISGFGGTVNYQAGMNYMLVIDGVAGAQCFFTVQVENPNCVENPPNPFNQNWGPMTSNAPNPIPCANPIPDNWYWLKVPKVPGAQEYHWWVKTGDATLKKGNTQGSDITLMNLNGDSILVNFNQPGTIEICAEAGNGCANTNQVCKVFTILTPPDRDTTVYICDEDANWPGTGVPNAPSPLPGAPFAPGNYTIVVNHPVTKCNYNFNIAVIKLPPNNKDLGTKVLCEGESYSYCGFTFTHGNPGVKNFICQGTGNSVPTRCDTNMTLNIVAINMTLALTASSTDLKCRGDKITLNGCNSNFTPSDAVATYKWYLNNILIPGATACSYDADSAGTYKFEMTVTYLGKSCTKNATINITSSYPPKPTAAAINNPGPFCNGQNYTFIITNPNNAFTYEWSLNGNSLGTGTTKSVTATAPTFTLCIDTKNSCDEDTSKCWTFPAILVPDRDTTVYICDEDATWPGTGIPGLPSPLPGAPFAPGFHKVILTNTQGCQWNFNITVEKYPPNTKDLGDKVLCENEFFTYCGVTFGAVPGGVKNFTCPGTGSMPPQSCDTLMTVNIIPIQITISLQNPGNINCPGDILTINGCNSSFTPSDATVVYKWYKNNVLISGASNCSLDVTMAGTYKFEMEVTYNGKTCIKSATTVVTANFPPIPIPALINNNGPFCNNQSYTFNITNYNAQLQYEWTMNGSVIGSGNSITTVVTAPSFQLCIKTSNVCNQDTNKCYNFNVITVPDRDTIVYICDEDPAWPGTGIPGLPSPLPGAPFPPGLHNVQLTTSQGCIWYFNITVEKYPPIYKDLGTKVLCQGELVNVCGQPIGWAQGGTNTVICQGTGSQPPRSCDTTVTITIVPIVINPIIDASATTFYCPNDQIILDACGSNTEPLGSNVTYKWTRNGAAFPNGNNCTITTTQPGTYVVEITVEYLGKSCKKTAQIVLNQLLPPVPVPANIVTPGPYCDGVSYTFSITNYNSQFEYTWQLDGQDIGSGQSVTVPMYLPNVKLCIITKNVCDKDTTKCYTIPVLEQPTEASIIGLDSVCQGGNSIFTVTNPQVGSTYSWIIPSGASIVSTTATSVTVRWGNTPGDKIICAVNKNKCGEAQACKDVYIRENPVLPVLVGPATICKGELSQFAVEYDAAATSYQWIVNGGNILVGQGSFGIEVAWTTTKDTASVCVLAKGICANSQLKCQKVKIINPPIDPALIGTAFICANPNSYVYKNTKPDPNADYTWNQTGGNLISVTKDSIIVQWLDEVKGIVTIKADNVCGDKLKDLTINVYKTPSANAGTDLKLCAYTGILNTQPSFGNGTWQVISKPTTATANITTTNQGTNFSSTECGLYRFQWKEDNNGCLDTDTVDVSVSQPPKVSNVSVICDTSKTFYTVSFDINGCGAPYVVKNLITGQQSVITLPPYKFVSPPLADSSTFRFVVYGANECVSDTIAGAKLCSCPTNAGEMDNKVLSACEDGSVQGVHKGNQNLQIDDTFEFVLHTSPGTQLGTVIDRNKTGKFSFINPPMKLEETYYISYIAGNKLPNGQVDETDPCFTVAPGQPVVFHAYPKPDAGADNTVCGKVAILSCAPDAPKGLWTLINGAGTVTFDDATQPKTNVLVSTFGIYTFRWTSDNFGCQRSDDVTVTFFPNDLSVSSPTKSCDNLGLTYTLKFNMQGGTPPYFINGQIISGSQYISNPIDAGGAFNFAVTDIHGCDTIKLNGTRECDCIAEVISLDVVDVCEYQTTQAVGTGKKGGKDIEEYFLCTNASLKSPINKILDRNPSGLFGFKAGMTCGTTYYIHYAIARPDPNNPQQLKFSDTCLQSISKPVVFECKPIVNAGALDTVCGKDYQLNGQWSHGTAQWSQISGAGTVTFNDATSKTPDIQTPGCGVYSFRLLADNKGCLGDDTVSVIFSKPPVEINKKATCNSIFTEYVVTFDIDGCGAPYTVSGMTGGNTVGTSYVSNGVPSDTIVFGYKLKDTYGCESTVVGQKNCQCLYTAPGTMSNNLIKVCIEAPGAGTVQGIHNGDQLLDPNDTYEFLLTDTVSPKKVGFIFDRNKTGIFSLLPSMKFGKTYYIAYVVGDSLPNGQVSTAATNKCLAYVWQPVVFYQCPKAVCPPQDTVYCGLIYTLRATPSVGQGKWTVLSKPANTTVNLTAPTNPTTFIKVSDYGTYQFQWLEDNVGYRDSCSVSILFKYITPPEIVSGPEFNCNTTDTTYTVSYTLKADAIGGAYELPFGTVSGTFNGNVFTSAPIKSDFSFAFQFRNANSCDTTKVSGIHHCPCKAESGQPTDAAVCEGKDSLISLSQLLINENVGGKWESLQPISGFNAANGSFRTAGVPSGTYYFRYGIPAKTTAPTCDGDSTTLKVVVNVTPVAYAGIDKVINCKTPTTTLGTDLSTAGSNIQYQWIGPASSTPSSKYTTADKGGDYILKVYNAKTGCFDYDTVSVTANKSVPAADFEVHTPTCKGRLDAGVLMKVTSAAFPLNYTITGYVPSRWTHPLDTFIDLGIKKPGRYFVLLEDANGCKSKDTINVPDGKEFGIDLGLDFTLDYMDSSIVQANLININLDEIIKIEWRPNVETLPNNPLGFKVRGDKDVQTYCLTIYNKGYCTAEDCIEIKMRNDKDVYIPTAFSPNDDGSNDWFTVYANPTIAVEVELLEVFDRWGNLMFKNVKFPPNDGQHGWNGTFRSQQLNPGVFVYHARVRFRDGTTKIFKGDITLLRY